MSLLLHKLTISDWNSRRSPWLEVRTETKWTQSWETRLNRSAALVNKRLQFGTLRGDVGICVKGNIRSLEEQVGPSLLGYGGSGFHLPREAAINHNRESIKVLMTVCSMRVGERSSARVQQTIDDYFHHLQRHNNCNKAAGRKSGGWETSSIGLSPVRVKVFQGRRALPPAAAWLRPSSQEPPNVCLVFHLSACVNLFLTFTFCY